MLNCTKCGSTDIHKERIMGADTMDKKCSDCGYTGHKNDFLPEKRNKEDK